MGDPDHNSDSEEEILIYAQFEDSVDIGKYRSIHVLGVDGKTPVIQMDDTFFTGQFENPLGTYMIFEDDPTPECADPLFDRLPDKNLKYLTKTRKLLNLEHAYVTPKKDTGDNVKTEKQQDDDIEIVNFSSVHEALERFKKDLIKNPDQSDSNLGESSKKPVDVEVDGVRQS